ncbi:MAG: hypothetical protein MAG458_00902 [Nitrosopumilus sp.]|nr:hypothetical protein [Nitrosopumilus sp.]
MNSINEKMNYWLSKIDEHIEESNKIKPKHIALYFDDNLLN